MEITSRDRSAAQTRASGQVVPLSPLFDRFEWHRRGMWHRAGCSMLALDGAQAFPAAPELLFRMIERRRVALHPDLDIRINVSRDRPEPESRADRTSLNASLATSICSLPGACRGSNSLQFNSIASITNSIQFPASGARNMGEVRNHTSLYFSLYSLYLAYRDGRWDERRYFRRCTILPATSAKPVSSANICPVIICPGQQHLPAICQHLPQHLGPSISASISMARASAPVSGPASQASQSASASIWPAHPCAARFGHLFRLLGRPSIYSGRGRT